MPQKINRSESRTDFPTAVQKILKVLEKGEPYTLNKLAQETGLNFRTVKKVLEFLEAQTSFLEDKVLEVYSPGENLTVIRLKEKTGLAMYPEHIQHLIIRTTYYPTTSREEEILAYLLMQSATSEEGAVSIPESKILQELIEVEHVAKTKNARYYLTSDGQIIAKGALKLYPELKNVKIDNVESSIEQIPIQLQVSVPMAPNTALIKQRLRGAN